MAKKPKFSPADPTAENGYPRDIARIRRGYGLPVSGLEHIRYAAGESPDRPATKESMARILRDVAPRASGLVRYAMLETAHRLETGSLPVDRVLIERLGPLGDAVSRVLDREPGEEG